MTKQEEIWKSDFGEEYTERNTWDINELEEWYKNMYGITCTDLYKSMLEKYIDKNYTILEVGCGSGNQIQFLKSLGYKNLFGLEIQKNACDIARKRTGVDITYGSVFEIPYNKFDVVRTSGLLIHISPKDINKALDEIYRCSRKYIMGFEYHYPIHTKIKYRDYDDILWKGNFPEMFINKFPNLKPVYEVQVKHGDEDGFDELYLLEKQ